MVTKHRGIVMSKKGMVASAHSLISSSGLKILNNNGNAVDAAIAMALTSGVVLPDMCGLGGDAFVLYYDAKTKNITAFNGSGPAPKKATIQAYNELGYIKKMPDTGIHSVSVPGAVDVYFTLLEKYGTKKFKELALDAIDLSKNGVPASEKVVRHMHTDYNKMQLHPMLCKTFLKNNKPYEPGDLIYNVNYAKSLEYLSKEGRDGFYKGLLAKKIVEYSKHLGGFLELNDFENYHCEILQPIKVNYRDYTIFQTPPVSQGIIHLEEMNILNQFDLKALKNDPASYIHLMVEAKKIAFHDRQKYFGDPKFINNPTNELLSDSYAKKQAKSIKMDSCLEEDGILPFENSHTTSFVVVDKDGNAVSFIHSIAGTWGSGELEPSTGILLNNRASQFSLDSTHPNCLNPNKKTMHTLNTYMVVDSNNNLRYVGNTPGGDNQPQWNMQVLTNIIDFGLDVQSATETPKWTEIDHHILKIESQVGEAVLEKLSKIGHKLEIIDPFTCSGASQIIEITKDGLKLGGSDPRADGCAMPQI